MSLYEIITDQILKKLEQGVIPWQRPYNGIVRPAMNFKSKKAYRGINALLLSMTGKRSPYWLTFKQANFMQGTIKKGSKGHKILYAKMVKVEDDEGNETEKAIYRYSLVFNLSDIEGIDCPYKDENLINDDVQLIDNCENLIKDMQERKKIPSIVYHDELMASYNFIGDKINTCKIEYYKSKEEYYSSLFHEIIHSTGHSSRLNRPMTGSARTKSYAKEELIAEIGSCFLCGLTGIKTKTIDNSVAYIEGWTSLLSNSPKLIIEASSKAQKAVDFLINNSK